MGCCPTRSARSCHVGVIARQPISVSTVSYVALDDEDSLFEDFEVSIISAWFHASLSAVPACGCRQNQEERKER